MENLREGDLRQKEEEPHVDEDHMENLENEFSQNLLAQKQRSIHYNEGRLDYYHPDEGTGDLYIHTKQNISKVINLI